MKITNQQETKDLQDMIINNFNYFEEEFQEINELESELNLLRENLSIPDYSGKPESLEIYKKTTIVSDIEDGYRSANSFASENYCNISNACNNNQINNNIVNTNNNPNYIKNITVTPRINLKEKNINNKFPILNSVTIDLNKV
jgi:hypothetical protein